VRDIETKKPIPGAEVSFSYPLTRPVGDAPVSSGTTGEDGVVQMRARSNGDVGITITTNANGYLLEETSVLDRDLQATKQPARVTVEMYAGPAPTIELVVPIGYRGLVKAEMKIQDDGPCPPDQRAFRYEVQPSGTVQVIGPPFLRRVLSPDFRAVDTDGTPVKRPSDDLEVGLRWLRCEGGYQYFVIGTRSEFDFARRNFEREDAAQSKPPPSSSNSGGKGKRNPGANQAGQGDQPPSN
jgi:hypothetical protein